MAVIVDDVRAGFTDSVQHELGPMIGFATGMVMIGLGIVLQEHLPFRGVTLMSIGGTLIALAVFVPYVTRKLGERLQPDITEELAEVESAVHAYVAEQVEELKELVVDIRGQVR